MARRYGGNRRERRAPHCAYRLGGRKAENFVIEAMTFYHGDFPPWLIKVEKASRDLDRRGGVDLLAFTACGLRLYFQIKSYYLRKDASALLQMADPHIPLILVRRDKWDRREVFEYTLSVIEKKYREIAVLHQPTLMGAIARA